MGRFVNRATGLLPLAVLSLMACHMDLPEGHYVCDPESPQTTCPAGHSCQIRSSDSGYRCYASIGSYCGDGEKSDDEQCDRGELGEETCRSQGFWSGVLSCGEGCRFDTSLCTRVTRLSAGGSHICGLDNLGQAYCWGANRHGELGQMAPEISSRPVKLYGDLRLTDLSMGRAANCGLEEPDEGEQGGTIWCWGEAVNEDNVPDVWFYHADHTVIGNARHSFPMGRQAYLCAVTTDGALECGFGALSVQEIALPASTQIVQLADNGEQVCALSSQGKLYCWQPDFPQDLSELTTAVSFQQVAGGSRHMCGLDANGAAWCWGDNEQGQLGDGTLFEREQPTAVNGDHTFVEIVAGQEHTCALDDAGVAWCWGWGELRSSEASFHVEPVAVSGQIRFTSLAAGSGFSCGAATGGKVYCWGWNLQGQVGVELVRDIPLEVTDGLSFTQLVPGGSFTMALDAEGGLWVWGRDAIPWVLSEEPPVFHAEPTQIFDEQQFSKVVVSQGERKTDSQSPGFACGIDLQGAMFCWGLGEFGELGVAGLTASPEPVAVADGTVFADIAAGGGHACGLDSSGHPWCWGDGSVGQLGRGASVTGATTPRMVSGGHTFASIHAGERFTVGIEQGGQPWFWGDGAMELAGGATTEAWEPIALGAAAGLTDLAVGENFLCGIDPGGSVAYCWGGLRGLDGDTPERYLLSDVTGVTAIHAGRGHVCAVSDGGVTTCYGANNFGQLGTGMTTDSWALGTTLHSWPMESTEQWSRITMGWAHLCALDAQGLAWCWGDGGEGQLGVDEYYPNPVEVMEP